MLSRLGLPWFEAVLLPQEEAPLDEGDTVHKVLFVEVKETGLNDIWE